jgi:hypothetical protein
MASMGASRPYMRYSHKAISWRKAATKAVGFNAVSLPRWCLPSGINHLRSCIPSFHLRAALAAPLVRLSTSGPPSRRNLAFCRSRASRQPLGTHRIPRPRCSERDPGCVELRRIHADLTPNGLESMSPTMVRRDVGVVDPEPADPFSESLSDACIGGVLPGAAFFWRSGA